MKLARFPLSGDGFWSSLQGPFVLQWDCVGGRSDRAMGELTRYCPACYTPNDWDSDRCLACDTNLQTDDSYDERLVWALDHPDSGIGMFASEVLAARKAETAIDSLIRLVDSPDPYRAAAAASALTAFVDDDRAKAAVAAARQHPSALVRRAVTSSEGAQAQRAANAPLGREAADTPSEGCDD